MSISHVLNQNHLLNSLIRSLDNKYKANIQQLYQVIEIFVNIKINTLKFPKSSRTSAISRGQSILQRQVASLGGMLHLLIKGQSDSIIKIVLQLYQQNLSIVVNGKKQDSSEFSMATVDLTVQITYVITYTYS